MKGDFSRLTFDSAKHHSRVLLQQGRLLLDADWNEQVAILVDRLETLVRDLVGPSAAPASDPGFGVDQHEHPVANDFIIGKGRLYVEGLCCENAEDTTYLTQPMPGGEQDLKSDGSYLVYVDAWEQVVSPHDDPLLLEPALNGLQTALRTRVVWQVRVERLPEPKPGNDWSQQAIEAAWPKMVEGWQPRHSPPTLRVRLADPSVEMAGTHRASASTGHYRRSENQLYRIEIQRGGRAGKGGEEPATFKWSRENGSVMLALKSLETDVAVLARPLGDPAQLRPGDWAEIVHPTARASRRPAPLLQVKAIGPDSDRITFHSASDGLLRFELGARDDVALRRWDQRASTAARDPAPLENGAVPIKPQGESRWTALEAGIEVQFDDHGRALRTGDYWIIAARTAKGGILLWPHDEKGGPAWLPAMGVEHRYAPLALFTPATASADYNYRTVFPPLIKTNQHLANLKEEVQAAKR